MSLAAPLIEYLNQLQAKGETHIALDGPARQILRKFYVKATQPSHSQPTSAPAATPSPRNTPQQKQATPVTPAVPVVVSGNTVKEKLESLKNLTANHLAFKQLNTLRTKIVFPESVDSAEIMFIGEAPGYHEERQGKPFAGPAGEKLNGILKAMGLSRQQVHITTVLKFRPALAHQTTNNRPASPAELEAARSLIEQEIKLIQPKVIVTLGSATARFFTKSENTLDELRDQTFTYKGIPVRPTFHPSHLLHQEDTTDRRKLWQDMLSAMDIVGMPVSEKQRGYFKPKA